MTTMDRPLPTPHTNESLAVKIESLEQQDRRLDSNVHELRADMHSGFQQINATMLALGSKIDASQRTSWATIASWIAVSVSIFTVIGAIGVFPIMDRITKLETFADKDGLTTAVESRFDSLEHRLDAYQQNTAEVRRIMVDNIIERIDRIDYYGTARMRQYMLEGAVSRDDMGAPHPEVSKGLRR